MINNSNPFRSKGNGWYCTDHIFRYVFHEKNVVFICLFITFNLQLIIIGLCSCFKNTMIHDAICIVEIRIHDICCCRFIQRWRVSCQRGPTRHAYAWLIGPFWQDTLEIKPNDFSCHIAKWRHCTVLIIKSPQYTGGDFMFLYRFIRRRRPQILVHAITFEQLFGFLSFLAQLLALTCRLPD